MKTCFRCGRDLPGSEFTQSYPKTCRDCLRVGRHVSKAKRRGMVANLTIEEWLETLEMFGYCCAYCGGSYRDLDHFVPIHYGGGTAFGNCLPACRPCNMAKANINPMIGFPTNGLKPPVIGGRRGNPVNRAIAEGKIKGGER